MSVCRGISRIHAFQACFQTFILPFIFWIFWRGECKKSETGKQRVSSCYQNHVKIACMISLDIFFFIWHWKSAPQVLLYVVCFRCFRVSAFCFILTVTDGDGGMHSSGRNHPPPRAGTKTSCSWGYHNDKCIIIYILEWGGRNPHHGGKFNLLRERLYGWRPGKKVFVIPSFSCSKSTFATHWAGPMIDHWAGPMIDHWAGPKIIGPAQWSIIGPAQWSIIGPAQWSLGRPNDR